VNGEKCNPLLNLPSSSMPSLPFDRNT
jgi:hypothetical protein